MTGSRATMAALLVLVPAAGALGAVVRALVLARVPRAGLHLVNVLGTLALALSGTAASQAVLAPWATAAIGIGFAGALTTFSGWMALVAERAVEDGWVRAIAFDVALPVVAAVALTVAVFAGT